MQSMTMGRACAVEGRDRRAIGQRVIEGQSRDSCTLPKGHSMKTPALRGWPAEMSAEEMETILTTTGVLGKAWASRWETPMAITAKGNQMRQNAETGRRR